MEVRDNLNRHTRNTNGKLYTIKSSQIKDCIDLLNEDESISTRIQLYKQ